jgi:hypothetical protein
LQLSGTVTELKALVGVTVEDPLEKSRIQALLTRLENVTSRTSSKSIKLPGSTFLEEDSVSKTPRICSSEGINVKRLKAGTCVISYTIVDSDGNQFTTEKKINFRK